MQMMSWLFGYQNGTEMNHRRLLKGCCYKHTGFQEKTGLILKNRQNPKFECISWFRNLPQGQASSQTAAAVHLRSRKDEPRSGSTWKNQTKSHDHVHAEELGWSSRGEKGVLAAQKSAKLQLPLCFHRFRRSNQHPQTRRQQQQQQP